MRHVPSHSKPIDPKTWPDTRSVFTEDLQYVQPNGKTIGRDRLMRDVAKQLAVIKNVDSESRN